MELRFKLSALLSLLGGENIRYLKLNIFFSHLVGKCNMDIYISRSWWIVTAHRASFHL